MRRLIAITSENNIFCEHRRIINSLRSNDFAYVHIRKPSFSEQQMIDYLKSFPEDIRQRLTLHSFQFLAKELNIGGVHLNKNLKYIPEDLKGKRLTASCHSVEELIERKKYCQYCFISPIYNSISKQDYNSKFNTTELKDMFNKGIIDQNVVALGGITFDNISDLELLGFSSFAMLSSAWSLPKTMFITDTTNNHTYISSAKKVLNNNIRFVQLRCKDLTNEKILPIAQELRILCDRSNALLTIDDRIELLSTNLFDGVHLGQKDMPINQAKLITKDRYLLGATCNTLAQAIEAQKQGADYIGMGPYAYTLTKKNLSPIIGLEGYKDVVNQIKIPIYAIGGIKVNDLKQLKNIGVYGVALSSVILNSTEQSETIKEILKIY